MLLRPLVRCVALSIALSLILTLGVTSQLQATVHAGDEAPDFTKTELGGGEISLSDYSGKVVILFLLGYG